MLQVLSIYFNHMYALCTECNTSLVPDPVRRPPFTSCREVCAIPLRRHHQLYIRIGRTDREQIRSRINNNDCRTFRPRRPLSTAYRTVLYAVDKGRYHVYSYLLPNVRLQYRAAGKRGMTHDAWYRLSSCMMHDA